jgi:hypothetical protein
MPPTTEELLGSAFVRGVVDGKYVYPLKNTQLPNDANVNHWFE